MFSKILKVNNMIPIRSFPIVLVAILITLCAACTGQIATQTMPSDTNIDGSMSSDQEIHPPEPPAEAPPPIQGKASISGVVYSYTIARIVPKTLFYLTPAVGEGQNLMPTLLIGPEEQNGDIHGTTNLLGQINLDDVPPGNYYLIVWAPYNWSIAENSPSEQRPRLIELNQGDSKALGILYVSWP